MVKGERMRHTEKPRKLVLSAAALAKLKKQGLPAHSVEAAAQWVKRRKKTAAAEGPNADGTGGPVP
jgi:hypothetical protein